MPEPAAAEPTVAELLDRLLAVAGPGSSASLWGVDPPQLERNEAQPPPLSARTVPRARTVPLPRGPAGIQAATPPRRWPMHDPAPSPSPPFSQASSASLPRPVFDAGARATVPVLPLTSVQGRILELSEALRVLDEASKRAL